MAAGSSGVRFARNSIYGNGGLAVDLDGDGHTANDPLDADVGSNGLFNHPSIESASLGSGQIQVSGALATDPLLTQATVYFFASSACDPSGYGEGQHFLGSSVYPLTGGGAEIDAVLPTPPQGMNVVTAISAAGLGGSDQSEFSNCVVATNAAPAPAPTPVVGHSGNAEPVSGRVTVQLPGNTQAVPLETLKNVPVGSIIDTRNGRVRLTVAQGGGEASAEFYAGRFKFSQSTKGVQLVTLTLLDKASGCSGKKAKKSEAEQAGVAKAKKRRKSGKLWGNGKGKFRTKGSNGSATVRGTIWRTSNKCEGTEFYVKRGVVDVRDNARKKTVKLKAGKRYLARGR